MRRGRQLVLVPGTFTYVLRECCSVRRVRNTGVLTQQYIQYRCTLLCTRCSYIRVLVPKCDTWYLYLVPCIIPWYHGRSGTIVLLWSIHLLQLCDQHQLLCLSCLSVCTRFPVSSEAPKFKSRMSSSRRH
jgi:hypothetical protein